MTERSQIKIHPFPSQTTRAKIHDIIRLHAHGRLSRAKMDEAITLILQSYGLSRIHLDGYTVRVAEPFHTPLGEFYVTHIEARYWGEEDRCPRCDSRGGYLEGGDQSSPWVMGCLGCGCVFKFNDKMPYRDMETPKS